MVFVEWESEKNYLTNLVSRVDFIRNGFFIKTKICKPTSKKIMQEITNFSKDKQIDFQKKYLLLDKDEITNSDFEKILSLAKEENITVLFSNPCFEVFLLLHYKEFNWEQSKNRYYKELTREMWLTKDGYEKNKAKLDDYDKYSELIPGKLREYLKNFKKLKTHHNKENKWVVEHLLNPYTNIDKFFDDIWLTKELER